MISTYHRNIIVTIFIIGLVFIIYRANQYFDDRKKHGHDTYMVVKGGTYEKCPDMDMFGFKFSVMLVLMGLNLLTTIILILSKNA